MMRAVPAKAMVRCCGVLWGAVLCCAVLYCTVLYCAWWMVNGGVVEVVMVAMAEKSAVGAR